MATPPRYYAKLCLLVLVIFLVVFTTAGYQALLPVLLKEGAYEFLCIAGPGGAMDKSHPQAGPVPQTGADGAVQPKCAAQLLRLNLMFTISMSVVNMSGLLVGVVITKYGARVSALLGASLLVLGGLLFAFSSTDFPAYLTAYVIMSGAGPFVAFPSFGMAQSAPRQVRGLVLSVIVGAFDGSAFMPLVFQLLNTYAGASLRQIYVGWSALAALCGVLMVWIFAPVTNDEGAITESGGGSLEAALIDDGESTPGYGAGDKDAQPATNQDAHVWFPNAHATSTLHMVLSAEFVTITVWSACYITAKYFYISNVTSELEYNTGSAQVAKTAAFVFSIILPAAGVFTPVTAFLMRYPPYVMVLIMSGLSGLLMITTNLSSVIAQYVSLVVMTANRFAFFSMAPLLLGLVFGDRGPGALYGFVAFASAIVNTSNFAWTNITIHSLGGSFLVFNLVLNGACVLSGLYMAYAILRWRNAAKLRQYGSVTHPNI